MDRDHSSSFTLHDITIANSVFEGDLDYSYSTTGTSTGIGLAVYGSQNVTLNHNEFLNWLRAAVLDDDTNLTMTDNDVHDIRSDGFDFANVDNVLIEQNYIHDFAIAPDSLRDHADMIQFWTSGTTSPSTNIVIRGNILDSGEAALDAIDLHAQRDGRRRRCRRRDVLPEHPDRGQRHLQRSIRMVSRSARRTG